MSDRKIIYLDDAIDAIQYAGKVGKLTCIDILKRLPSAQPEQIRCKDCVMHGVCRFEEGLGMNGYCSQAKRREDED